VGRSGCHGTWSVISGGVIRGSPKWRPPGGGRGTLYEAAAARRKGAAGPAADGSRPLLRRQASVVEAPPDRLP